MNEYVKKRWYDFCRRMEATGDIDWYWAKIEESYSEPGRAYHRLKHLEMMFRAFDEFVCLKYDNQLDQLEHERLIKEKDATELSIFVHDMVMNKLSQTNEEDSFEFAKEIILRLHLPWSLKMPAEIMITATKHDYYRSGEKMTWVLLDLDLLSLGQLWEEYLVVESEVRKEYEWVPVEIYEERRVTQFIIPFLRRPSIYMTSYFKGKYEEQARSNLLKKWGPQIRRYGEIYGITL